MAEASLTSKQATGGIGGMLASFKFDAPAVAHPQVATTGRSSSGAGAAIGLPTPNPLVKLPVHDDAPGPGASGFLQLSPSVSSAEQPKKAQGKSSQRIPSEADMR